MWKYPNAGMSNSLGPAGWTRGMRLACGLDWAQRLIPYAGANVQHTPQTGPTRCLQHTKLALGPHAGMWRALALAPVCGVWCSSRVHATHRAWGQSGAHTACDTHTDQPCILVCGAGPECSPHAACAQDWPVHVACSAPVQDHRQWRGSGERAPWAVFWTPRPKDIQSRIS